MHVKTERWTETDTRRVYVGCVGYDDPVYEEEEYTKNCSREVVEFDDSKEKKDFFELIQKFKPTAQQIVSSYNRAVEEAVKRHVAAAEAKRDKEYSKYKARYDAEPAWYRFFMTRPDYKVPRINWDALDWDDDYDLVPLKQSVENEYSVAFRPDNLAQARVVLSMPDKYENFIVHPTLKQYNMIVEFCKEEDYED